MCMDFNALCGIGCACECVFLSVFVSDVTQGDNKCIGGSYALTCCDTGFEAAVGWDAVTGLGTISLSTCTEYCVTAGRTCVHACCERLYRSRVCVTRYS